VQITSTKNILYKLTFRNKYDLLANNLSRNIFNLIKAKNDSFNTVFVSSGFIIELNVVSGVKIKLKNNTFQIDAAFFYPESTTEKIPKIKINIVINVNFSPVDYQKFNYDLYEKVRHEYEHYDKYTVGFRLDNEYINTAWSLKRKQLDIKRIELIKNHILSTTELDAYARSIVYIAKKRKVDYKQVIDEIINKLFYHNNREKEIELKKIPDVIWNEMQIKEKLEGRINEIFQQFHETFLT